MVLERTKISSWVPTGSEAKNDFTVEGQQQITALLCSEKGGNIELRSNS
jgi:hypothetical protein